MKLNEKALRQQHHEHPDWDQKQLQAWLLEAYRRSISQSTIFESLSPRYRYLDSKHLRRHEQEQAKQRQAAYPILKNALFEWQQHLQHQWMSIIGDMIQKTASQF